MATIEYVESGIGGASLPHDVCVAIQQAYEISGREAVIAEIDRITALGRTTSDRIVPDPEIGNERRLTVVVDKVGYDLTVYEATKHRGSSMRVATRPVTTEECG